MPPLSGAERAALERFAIAALREPSTPYASDVATDVVGRRVWRMVTPTLGRLIRRGLVRLDVAAPLHLGSLDVPRTAQVFPLLLTRAGLGALPPRFRVDWALISGP